MKWSYKDPVRGDMIRVAVGTIYHFGIYVSDGEVIQFGLPPSRRGTQPDCEVEVLSSDIDSFLAGGFLEVCEFDKKERRKNRTPDEIVGFARSRLGTRGYNILYNNCEHFANECVTGTPICRQAEDVRALFRNMPIVDVYIAALPEEGEIGELDCRARREEIASISNERLRREKYFVWRLLEYALERSFGACARKLKLRKESYGGWSAGDISLSLSHSEGALAVAVSRAAVGVDIERVCAPRSDRLAERIMTAEELADYRLTPDAEREERLIAVWTAKEAIFKSRHLDVFIPGDCDTLHELHRTAFTELGGVKYAWSVATVTPERVRVFEGIDLTK